MVNFVRTHFMSFFCFFLCMLALLIIVGFSSVIGSHIPMTNTVGLTVYGVTVSLFGGFVVNFCNGN